MLKVALTHDVDRVRKTYQYLTHSLKCIKNSDYNKLIYQLISIIKKNPYWNFDKIIKIEKEHNVKSTFFFLNESIRFTIFNKSNWKLSLGRYDIFDRNIVKIIQYLDQSGWEIGVHGSYNSYKDKELLLKEKKTLEDIVGHEIIGVRQHYLNLNENTWKIQKEVGFKYDSSFGYRKNIGFKDNKYNYFFPFNDELVVFPLVIMDNCFIKKQNKWNEFIKIVDIVEKEGSLLVVNWHQRVFNKNEFPGYSKYYLKIINELKKRKAQFYRLSDYYNELINESK